MKFISSTQATVALHVSADDVRPVQGVLTRDLIAVVGEHYQFSVQPQIPPGFPPQALPVLGFQSGVFVQEMAHIPIMSLNITPAGTSITAYDSDACDKILDDYISLLDDTLNHRIKDAPQKRSYQSNIVVEFDPPLEHLISALGTIEGILNEEIKRESFPFKTKRLSFGYGDTAQPIGMIQRPLEAMDSGDFQIERRAQEPYDRNRYFCTAPVRTSNHVRLMEMIDRALSTRG